MNTLTKVFVGVDVSLDTLDVYIHPIVKSMKVSNSKEGLQILESVLKNYDVQQTVCESTGGYEDLAYDYLLEIKCKPWRVDPKRILAFTASEGIKYKTDKIDAKMIALFASQKSRGYEATVNKNPLLAALAKRKSDLVEIASGEKKRLRHPSSLCKLLIQEHVDFIEKQIGIIEKEIEKIINNDDDLNAKNKILQSVPGVGKTTAAILLATLPELGALNEKEISALVGVAPYVKQSGKFVGNSKISSGRFITRRGIYMAALTGSRKNPILSKFYNKLLQAGKKPKVALVAVMHKLIIILNAMLRKREAWSSNI